MDGWVGGCMYVGMDRDLGKILFADLAYLTQNEGVKHVWYNPAMSEHKMQNQSHFVTINTQMECE